MYKRQHKIKAFLLHFVAVDMTSSPPAVMDLWTQYKLLFFFLKHNDSSWYDIRNYVREGEKVTSLFFSDSCYCYWQRILLRIDVHMFGTDAWFGVQARSLSHE